MALELEQMFWERNKAMYKQVYAGKFLVIFSKPMAATWSNYFGPRTVINNIAYPLLVRSTWEAAFRAGVRLLGAGAEFMVKEVDETPGAVYGHNA